MIIFFLCLVHYIFLVLLILHGLSAFNVILSVTSDSTLKFLCEHRMCKATFLEKGARSWRWKTALIIITATSAGSSKCCGSPRELLWEIICKRGRRRTFFGSALIIFLCLAAALAAALTSRFLWVWYGTRYGALWWNHGTRCTRWLPSL